MSVRGKILLVDDEPDLKLLYAKTLELEGYEVKSAATAASALKFLEAEKFDVVLSDVRLELDNGIDLIPEYKKRNPFAEIVLMTAYGTISDGVRSIKKGAFEYLAKGEDHARLFPVIEQAVNRSRAAARLFVSESSGSGGFDSILGNAPAIAEAKKLAARVADSEASVLILGDTGTGKELFASAIHAASRRAKGPFMAINCSALGKEVLESELFGHVKGAFTGALQDKKGFFEMADGGTLFLDEIGEMSAELQPKLLRVLESGRYYKMGSTREESVNVRIVAATHRHLEEWIGDGRFRADLYYRLATFVLHLPSLNQRLGDLPVLADFFAARAAARIGKGYKNCSPGFLSALGRHEWKGNLRELRNVMERCVILSESETLEEELLPFQEKTSARKTLPQAVIDLESLEKEHISNMLEFTGGNRTKTAEILGISQATLYRKIQEYGF